MKGGVIGVLFALLFGPVGWIAMGAAAGGLFASFDRGIKQKLLKELGENMTASESVVAILVECADWPAAVARMKSYGFVARSSSPNRRSDEDEVEALLADPKTRGRPRGARDRRGRPRRGSAADRAEATEVGAGRPEPGRSATRSARSRASALRTAEKLVAVGIKSTDDLLAGAGPDRARALAGETGIGEDVISGGSTGRT